MSTTPIGAVGATTPTAEPPTLFDLLREVRRAGEERDRCRRRLRRAKRRADRAEARDYEANTGPERLTTTAQLDIALSAGAAVEVLEDAETALAASAARLRRAEAELLLHVAEMIGVTPHARMAG